MEQVLVDHFKNLLSEPQRNRSKEIAKKEIPKLVTLWPKPCPDEESNSWGSGGSSEGPEKK